MTYRIAFLLRGPNRKADRRGEKRSFVWGFRTGTLNPMSTSVGSAQYQIAQKLPIATAREGGG